LLPLKNDRQDHPLPMIHKRRLLDEVGVNAVE
jgi:hypothetical protein